MSFLCIGHNKMLFRVRLREVERGSLERRGGGRERRAAFLELASTSLTPSLEPAL